MKVTFTDRAESDLEVIADWIAQDNPFRAAIFIQDLRDSCLNLAGAPFIHPVMSGFEEYDLRRRPYRGYLIFYKALKDVIEITRILHGARDYGAMLSDGLE